LQKSLNPPAGVPPLFDVLVCVGVVAPPDGVPPVD
jgi:hypothetical protein